MDKELVSICRILVCTSHGGSVLGRGGITVDGQHLTISAGNLDMQGFLHLAVHQVGIRKTVRLLGSGIDGCMVILSATQREIDEGYGCTDYYIGRCLTLLIAITVEIGVSSLNSYLLHAIGEIRSQVDILILGGIGIIGRIQHFLHCGYGLPGVCTALALHYQCTLATYVQSVTITVADGMEAEGNNQFLLGYHEILGRGNGGEEISAVTITLHGVNRQRLVNKQECLDTRILLVSCGISFIVCFVAESPQVIIVTAVDCRGPMVIAHFSIVLLQQSLQSLPDSITRVRKTVSCVLTPIFCKDVDDFVLTYFCHIEYTLIFPT